MSNSVENKGGCKNGCFKLLMVSAVLGFIGVLILSAIGGVVYKNREKMGIPPMEEWPQHIETVLNGEGEGNGEGSSSGETGSQVKDRPPVQVIRPVVSRAPLHVNQASFAQASQRSDVLVLVDYYADWCGPCKRLSPSLERLVQKHGDKVVVLKVNVDSEKELARQAGVSSIPDVRIMHGGKELDKFVGLIPYESLEKMILGYESLLPPPATGSAGHSTSGEGTIDPITKEYLPPGILRK